MAKVEGSGAHKIVTELTWIPVPPITTPTPLACPMIKLGVGLMARSRNR
jgi:hypothetical protein